MRKHLAGVVWLALFVGLVVGAVAALSHAGVPTHAEPEQLDITTTSLSPREAAWAAVERIDPNGDLDELTLVYLHAACWPEQHGGQGHIPEIARDLPCPIPPDELPHPGPDIREVLDPAATPATTGAFAPFPELGPDCELCPYLDIPTLIELNR